MLNIIYFLKLNEKSKIAKKFEKGLCLFVYSYLNKKEREL